MRKRILSLLLCLCMALSLLPSPASAAGRFTDVTGGKLADGVNIAAERGLVSGYSDNSFRPNDPVTHGAEVKMLMSILVHQGEWEPGDTSRFGVFYPYTTGFTEVVGPIMTVGDNMKRILNSTTVNSTRADVAETMYYMAMAYKCRMEGRTTFLDANAVSMEKKVDFLNNLTDGHTIVAGFSDGLLHLDWGVTRAQMANFAVRLDDALEAMKKTAGGDMHILPVEPGDVSIDPVPGDVTIQPVPGDGSGEVRIQPIDDDPIVIDDPVDFPIAGDTNIIGEARTMLLSSSWTSENVIHAAGTYMYLLDMKVSMLPDGSYVNAHSKDGKIVSVRVENGTGKVTLGNEASFDGTWGYTFQTAEDFVEFLDREIGPDENTIPVTTGKTALELRQGLSGKSWSHNGVDMEVAEYMVASGMEDVEIIRHNGRYDRSASVYGSTRTITVSIYIKDGEATFAHGPRGGDIFIAGMTAPMPVTVEAALNEIDYYSGNIMRIQPYPDDGVTILPGPTKEIYLG